MSASTQLGIIVLILVLGFLGQLLADKLKIPSIVFLLAFGIILGPEFLGVIELKNFMSSLQVLISFSVAIIIFEGGINLDLREIRHTSGPILGLITIGVVVTCSVTAILSNFLLGLSWGFSLLFGALITATGPTVTRPLMRQTRVQNNISSIIEFEGVLNDPISALLAVVIFSMVSSGSFGALGLLNFFWRIGFGAIVGLIGGYLIYFFFKFGDLSEQYVRFSSIIFALAVFVSADIFIPEAGIMAVAIASIILGSHDFQHKERVIEFKEDISVVLLSIIFILLAALVSFEDISPILPWGVVVVLGILFLARPLAVYLSSIGSTLKTNEKSFISLIGPKGVVPAAMATFFTLEMEGGGTILGLVFLTIIVSVLFSGIFARPLAKFFDVMPMEVIIAGGGGVGSRVAERLHERGENVVVIDLDEEVAKNLRKKGIKVVVGSASNPEVLEKAGCNRTKFLIAATNDDETNLMVCQIAKSKFSLDSDKIVARVNDEENFDAFSDLGIKSMNPDLSSALILESLITRPEVFNMMEIGREGDIVEIKVKDERVIGKKLKNVCGEGIEECKQFPRSSLIVLVKRGEEDIIPHGDLVFEEGDRLTILGREKAVREARSIFESD
ncbi:sodium:proton antiporter [archaeon SCG-AAA382B04]|nr:sodium:proton antiporter [archaeon SCG-AAA382B04]